MMQKKRILGICGVVSPAPYANAICLENVFKELTRFGYECHILGVGEEQKDFQKEGINLHVVKMPVQRNSYLKRINSTLRLTALPQTEPEVTRIKYKRAKELQEELKFDYVFGICASYANIYAALLLKEDFPNIKIVGYYLDSIESLSRLSGLTRKIRDYFSYRGEEQVFHRLDGMVLPIASSKIYGAERYTEFHGKTIYAEFPTFIPKDTQKTSNNKEKTIINGMIVGTLNNTFRNPKALFEAIRLVCDKNKQNLHIDVYGPNDESLFLPLAGSSFVSYKLHGRVPHQEIDEALARSDMLINISNSGLLAVPSKIFEYFSAYKPILTQVSDENDSALPYYKKYSGSHLFYVFKEKAKQIENLSEFLESINQREVNVEEVNNAFRHNTPTYVANQIRTMMES